MRPFQCISWSLSHTTLSGKCPPCFNCMLPAFTCGQYGECDPYNGQCNCPPEWGGIDCLTPRTCTRLSKPRVGFTTYAQNATLLRTEESGTYAKMERTASARRVGEESTAMVCLPVLISVLINPSPVCQTDNSCTNFPIRGNITSLDPVDSVNMTCYKGGETVFNNHQFCDVTSTHMSHSHPLCVLTTNATQTAKSLICYLVALPRLPLAVTRRWRHAISNFGPPRSNLFTAHSVRARRK